MENLWDPCFNPSIFDPGVTKQNTNRYTIALLTFSISVEMERNGI